MNLRTKILVILLIGAGLVINGCISQTIVDPGPTQSLATPLLKQSATQTPSPVPTATPIPTLPGWIRLLTITKTVEPTIEWRVWTPEVEPDQTRLAEKATAYMEQKTDCVFPCWLGITNGFTRYDGAQTVLKNVFGSSFSRAVFPNNIKKIVVGLPSVDFGNYTEFVFSNDLNILTYITLIDKKPFQLSRVLNEYGKPDRILLDGWIATDNRIPAILTILVYDKKGMYFVFYNDGILKDTSVRFCPQYGGALYITLWDPKSDMTFEYAIMNTTGYELPSPLDRPLETVFDGTVETFTEQMSDISHSGCLEISRSKWGEEK